MTIARATALSLLLLICLAATAAGEDLPPEEGRFTGPCMGDEAFGDTWLDRTHSYITVMLCQPSVWFDGFFGSRRAGEDWPGSLIRWQGAYRLDEREEEAGYRSEFSASFRLPKMTRKLKVVVTSESADDTAATHPFSSETPLATGTPQDNRTTAGLRFDLADTKRFRLSLGGGARTGDPWQPYARVRLRYTQPLGSSTLLRLTPSAIWLTEDGLNRYLHLDLDHRASENVLLRASQSLSRKELDPGTSWGSTLTLYDRLSVNTVLAFEAGARGLSYPQNHVERYRLSTRLRSNFFRSWLFLEFEPEIYWPRDDDGEFHFFRAVTFRLEMQFYS